MEFRYEIGGDIQSIVTSANGTAHVILNTGNLADDSYSGNDLGSHGILAWTNTESNKIIGVSTVTIDPDVFEIDLYVNPNGVSVERIRENSTITLDENIGFTGIRGDSFVASIPVVNKGLRLSPAAVLQITGPDGTISDANIPRLSSLEEARVEVSWEVPANQPFGNILMSFNIEIDDGDLTNNEGEFSLFIGAIPVALLTIVEESLTLDEVTFNGLNSYDPDGGLLDCTFSLESLSGDIVTSQEDDCIFEYTWNDDGIFTVNMVITDEESDFDSVSSEIIIINRAPEITVSTDSETSPVLSPITFEITERNDLDSLNPQAPVDILWKAPCEQGNLGIKCTLTPDQEGPYTVEVEAMDDDGAVTTESYTIDVTNIAPYNPEWEVLFDGNRMTANSFGLYTVNEGDQLTIRGWAEDSDNDMSSLRHVWTPDAEDYPDVNDQQEGLVSSIEHIYNTEGQHIATFQVFDDNDESTDLMTVPFKVNNIAPIIRPFSQPLPVAEDQQMQISIIVQDTIYDMESLVPCYDIDPYSNSDNLGNSSDDCDIEAYYLEYAWPNSDTAPDHIVFHVTDNDGAIDSVNISIDVRNMKPKVGMTTSEYQPTAGEMIILTGNGTTDSVYDMDNMQYWWDMDLSKDTDGDGDKSNDQDITGKMVEWSFSNAKDTTIQLTVYDGDSSDSMRITIQVQEKPFALSDVLTNPMFIGIIVLSILGVVGLLMRKKNMPLVVSSITEGNMIMDDAFDDPEFDPFSKDKQKQKISKKRIKQDKNKPTEKNSENIDSDLIINPNENEMLQEMEELKAKLKELEDKNLSANEVMSSSEIEELIGEEE
jgi:hypothetical protein